MLRGLRSLTRNNPFLSNCVISSMRMSSWAGRTMADEEVAQYRKDGIFVARQFFSNEETAILREAATCERLDAFQFRLPDSEGRTANLTIFNELGEDSLSYAMGSERMVGAAEQLLLDPTDPSDAVYFYHGKINKKEPDTGGSFVWHQDYGYWYFNGNLYPSMLSVFVALTPMNKQNGTLEALLGSNKMGRLDHNFENGQNTPAEPERLAAIESRLPRYVAELQAGDALFLDCLTLHMSGPNLSKDPRWSMVACFNTKKNNPITAHHHASYTPLTKVPDTALLERGVIRCSVPLMDARDDKTTRIDDETAQRLAEHTHLS